MGSKSKVYSIISPVATCLWACGSIFRYLTVNILFSVGLGTGVKTLVMKRMSGRLNNNASTFTVLFSPDSSV